MLIDRVARQGAGLSTYQLCQRGQYGDGPDHSYAHSRVDVQQDPGGYSYCDQEETAGVHQSILLPGTAAFGLRQALWRVGHADRPFVEEPHPGYGSICTGALALVQA